MHVVSRKNRLLVSAVAFGVFGCLSAQDPSPAQGQAAQPAPKPAAEQNSGSQSGGAMDNFYNRKPGDGSPAMSGADALSFMQQTEISFPMEQTIIDLLDDQEVQIAKVGLFQREGIMTTVVYRLKRTGIESSQELVDLESKITEKDIIREIVFWLGSGETVIRKNREKWSLGKNVIPVEAVIGRYDFGANVFKAEALSRLRPNSKGIIENPEYAHMLGFALPKSGLIQLPGGQRQTLSGEWVKTRTMVQLSDDKTTIAKIEHFVDGKISQIVVNRSDGIKINPDFLNLQPSSLDGDGGGFQTRTQNMPPAMPSVDVLNKSVLGLGISTRLNTETAPFLVTYVVDKSLAKAMGFEVGQVIEEINGESVTGLTRNEVVSRLKTLAGTADFTVKVSSGGPQSKTLKVSK